MRRKGLGIFLALCLLVCSLTLSMSAEEPTGTPISTPGQLIALMGDPTAWAQDYYLTTDIDLSGRTDQTPIGSAGKNFTGTFDGCGYEIKGLNLVKSDMTSASDINWALFGRVNGATIKNLTVSGTVDGSAKGRRVGGIVGVCVTGTAKIENCVNNCTVSGAKYVGGIVGHVASGSIVMSNCMNTGSVTALTPDGKGYADLGGLIGLAQGPVTMTNCMNTGSLTAPTATSTKSNGGLVGRIQGASGAISQCYSAGEMESGLSCAFVGFMSGTLTSKKNYYLIGDGYAENISASSTVCTANGVDLSTVTDIESCKAAFAELPAANWVFTAAGPELLAFHAHYFGEDNKAPTCATCGMENPKACQHSDTEEVVDTPSTCVTEGRAHKRCKDCGETVGESYALPTNPNAHTNFDYVWHKDGASYYYNCADCGKTAYTQDDAPTLYVDAYTKASAMVGSDENDGLSTETALKTIDEAFTRLAAVGGTVCLSDRYYVSGVTLPANSEKITITSLSTAKTGFYFKTNNARFRINGDVEFCNLFLFADKAEARTILFACNWHNVTFGDGLATSVSAIIVAGTENGTDDIAEMTQNLTFRGVNQTKMTGGENLETACRFYDQVVLGNRTNNTKAYLTANKTVAATFENYNAFVPQIGAVRCGTAGAGAAVMENCAVTAVFSGGSTIASLVVGDTNAKDGAAVLDALTLELKDNAVVTTSFNPRNVKNSTIRISTEAEGRTKPLAKAIEFAASDDFIASLGKEKATASITYGAHGFADTVADAVVYNEDVYTVDESVTEEGTWTKTNKDGVYAETCETCGRTGETIVKLTQGTTTKAHNGTTYAVRFITELTFGTAEIEYYGTFIAKTLNTAFSDETLYRKSSEIPETTDGAFKYAVDLVGIPEGQTATEICAWSFVKLKNVDDMIVLPCKVTVDSIPATTK